MTELDPQLVSSPGEPASEPSAVLPVHKSHIYHDRLRPLWSLFVYVGIGLVIAALLNWIFSSLQNASGVTGLWVDLLNDFVLAFSAMTPAFIMAKIERRPFDAYGLPRTQSFGRLFWAGVLWGLVSLTCLVLVMHGTGVFDFGPLALHGRRVFKFAIYWAAFFLFVGFFEEFLFRGYTLFTLSHGINFWPAAIFLSICFGAVHWHNPGETWVGLLAAALIGLFLCFTVRRTGSLWFAVGFHASWDWAESFLYSVPDSGGMVTGHLLKTSIHGPVWLSGGSVGPEGSAVVFVVLIIMTTAFNRIYRVAKYPAADFSQQTAALPQTSSPS
jgi:hypothetical protein